MDSDRGKKRAKKMEQRCHFKITGSGSGFHYFLWQGASKKKIQLMSFVFFFLQSVKATGHGTSDFALLGDLGAGALENSGKGRMARRQQGPQQAARVEEARGQRTLCVFNSDSVIFLPNGGLQSENLQSILILSGLFAWCSS